MMGLKYSYGMMMCIYKIYYRFMCAMHIYIYICITIITAWEYHLGSCGSLYVPTKWLSSNQKTVLKYLSHTALSEIKDPKNH